MGDLLTRTSSSSSLNIKIEHALGMGIERKSPNMSFDQSALKLKLPFFQNLNDISVNSRSAKCDSREFFLVAEFFAKLNQFGNDNNSIRDYIDGQWCREQNGAAAHRPTNHIRFTSPNRSCIPACWLRFSVQHRPFMLVCVCARFIKNSIAHNIDSVKFNAFISNAILHLAHNVRIMTQLRDISPMDAPLAAESSGQLTFCPSSSVYLSLSHTHSHSNNDAKSTVILFFSFPLNPNASSNFPVHFPN